MSYLSASVFLQAVINRADPFSLALEHCILSLPLCSLSTFLLAPLQFHLPHYPSPRLTPEPLSLLSAPSPGKSFSFLAVNTISVLILPHACLQLRPMRCSACLCGWFLYWSHTAVSDVLFRTLDFYFPLRLRKMRHYLPDFSSCLSLTCLAHSNSYLKHTSRLYPLFSFSSVIPHEKPLLSFA